MLSCFPSGLAPGQNTERGERRTISREDARAAREQAAEQRPGREPWPYIRIFRVAHGGALRVPEAPDFQCVLCGRRARIAVRVQRIVQIPGDRALPPRSPNLRRKVRHQHAVRVGLDARLLIAVRSSLEDPDLSHEEMLVACAPVVGKHYRPLLGQQRLDLAVEHLAVHGVPVHVPGTDALGYLA